jgi:hypothetical protein
MQNYCALVGVTKDWIRVITRMYTMYTLRRIAATNDCKLTVALFRGLAAQY